MSAVHIPKRPLFQFSLRTLLLAFVVVALLLGYLVVPIHTGLRRCEVQRKLKLLGATIETEQADIGWARTLLPKEASEEITEVFFIEHEPTDEDLSLLRECPRIQSLHFESSRFTDVGFKHISALKDLQELFVQDTTNRINNDSLKHLAKLEHVDRLWLSSSGITDQGLTQLDWLRRLTLLGLSGCTVSDKTIESLGKSENLQSLYLSDTLITDQGLHYLKQFPKLENLDLGGTKISDKGLIVVGSLTRLKRLTLDDTDITDDGIQHLRKLHNLEYLELFETKITDASVPHLLALTNLRTLILFDTSITKEAANQLRALPQLRTLILCPGPTSPDNELKGAVNPEE